MIRPRKWRSRWEGDLIYYTKDCRNGCEWYREYLGVSYCGWGVAFKVLTEPEKPRKCDKGTRKQPEYPSAIYLDETINSTRDLWKQPNNNA